MNIKQILISMLLLISNLGYSQNYFDVWKITSAMKKSNSKDTTLFKERPKQFNATDKDGHLITYYRVDNKISVKTSSKKKVKVKESIFYTTKIDKLSILTINEDTVDGFIQDNEKILNMRNGEVSESPNLFFNTNLEDEAILSPSMSKKDKNFRNPKNKNKAESSPVPRVFTDTAGTSMLPKTLRGKFTCDYKLYQSWNNNPSNLTNFVNGFFVGVQELYRREGIPLSLKEIYIYDTPDPWVNYTNQGLELNDFATANPTTDTCMNMLLTSKPWGGLAYVDMLNGMYANSISGIYNTFAPLPTYSWTIGVVTHEWGHTIGSKHTHWCGWRLNAGVYGRIDSCYAGETANGVSCGTLIKYPSGGGTIMSYCHLNYQVGINFNKGFGPLVRYKLRKSIIDSRIAWNTTSTPCTTNYIVSSTCWNNTWRTRNYTQTGNNCTTPPMDSLIRFCPIQSVKVQPSSYSTNVIAYQGNTLNRAFDGDTVSNNSRFVSPASSIVTMNYTGNISSIKLYFGFLNNKTYTSPVTRYQIIVDGVILYNISSNTKLSVIHSINRNVTSKIEVRLMDNTFNRVREIEIYN